MSQDPYRVMFLCTGNGRVHPLALELLKRQNHQTSALRSKSWEEFAERGADAYRMLSNRIGVFVNLPLASLERLTLHKRLEEIGRQ
jgi:hypothetical protein